MPVKCKISMYILSLCLKNIPVPQFSVLNLKFSLLTNFDRFLEPFLCVQSWPSSKISFRGLSRSWSNGVACETREGVRTRRKGAVVVHQRTTK